MEQHIIINPVMDEEMEFITTTDQTGGLYFEFFQILFRKKSGFIREHIHFGMDETFEILEGTATYRINHMNRIATAGESVFIPRAIPHINPYNLTNERLVMRRKNEPDRAAENFYRKVYQLSTERKVNNQGQPNILQSSVIAYESNNETFFTFAPIWLQKLVINIFGPIGLLLG